MRSWSLLPWQIQCARQQQFWTVRSSLRPSARVRLHRQKVYPPSTRHYASLKTDNRALIHLKKPFNSKVFEDDERPLPLPSRSERKFVAAWAHIIEPFLPADLRKASAEATDHPPSILGRILEQAERQSSVDVLTHLGLVESRWDVVLWIANTVIDESSAPSQPWRIPDLFPSFEWPKGTSLDEFTRRHVTRKEILRGGGEDWENPRLRAIPSAGNENVSIERDLSPLVLQVHEKSGIRARMVLGQLWLSLGRMLLAAATNERRQSEAIVSSAVKILAKLQGKGFIPNDTSRKGQQEGYGTILHQPPVVAVLSNIITHHVAHDQNLQTSSSTPPVANPYSLSTKVELGGIQEDAQGLSPEVWLEYVLWCCVHGAWLMEGVGIIAALKKGSGSKRLSLAHWLTASKRGISRANIVESPSRAAITTTSEGAQSEQACLRQTISAEVVVALADGLVAMLRGEQAASSYTSSGIVEGLQVLRSILDRDGMSLGMSTWDVLITRAADSPALRSPNVSPRLLESVLSLAGTYRSEVEARKGAAELHALTHDPHYSYILEGSAAVLGLYHRSLHDHIRARDASGALRLLGSLQNLTDKNKQKSLNEFFEELSSTEVDNAWASTYHNRSIGRHDGFPGVQYPAFFPILPVGVLADLLDLLNDCEAFELGSWMIYSSDIDGPLIPERELGNQVIAPALIRFAAATSDTTLLRKLTRAQSTTISGLTLVALCENKIRQADFREASKIFGLIRDYALHDWEAFDFARILRALLLQIYGVDAKQSREHSHAQQASTLFQRLLRGDLGQVWGTRSFAQIDSLVEILSSLDEYLAGLCSNLMPLSQKHIVRLDSRSFNCILDASCKIWGSGKGRDVWLQWCQDDIVRSSTTRFSSKRGRSVGELFSAAPAALASVGQIDASKPEIEGCVPQDISSLRIIIQQALEERRQHSLQRMASSSANEDLSSHDQRGHEILEWAAEMLRSVFRLSMPDVEYELQGHLSIPPPGVRAVQDYSAETMRIWQAFYGNRKAWARSAEDSLRRLAASKPQSKITFDAQPAAERFLLLSLAKDLGLAAEIHNVADGAVSIIVSKSARAPAHVPSQHLDEVSAEAR